jgi:hypothetical protein
MRTLGEIRIHFMIDISFHICHNVTVDDSWKLRCEVIGNELAHGVSDFFVQPPGLNCSQVHTALSSRPGPTKNVLMVGSRASETSRRQSSPAESIDSFLPRVRVGSAENSPEREVDSVMSFSMACIVPKTFIDGLLTLLPEERQRKSHAA